MNPITVVNVLASAIMTLSVVAFLVFLFGRHNSLIHRLGPVNVLMVKLSLSVCAAGSLYNVLSASTPPVSEVVVNVGFAALFSWAACFHYHRFVRPLQQTGSKKELRPGLRQVKKA